MASAPPPPQSHQVNPAAFNYSGAAFGDVTFTIESAAWGSDKPRRSTVRSLWLLLGRVGWGAVA